MRIPILTYHSLKARGTNYQSSDHDALEVDLTLLKENGFRVERLITLVDAFNRGQADDYEGEKVCAITFDDGATHDFVDFYHPDRGLLKSFARILAEATDSSRVGWDEVPATSFVIASPDARDMLDVQCIAGRNQWHHHWWEEAIRVAHFDIGIFVGSIGFFFVLFLLYSRTFPVIAQAELKTIVKSSSEQYKK